MITVELLAEQQADHGGEQADHTENGIEIGRNATAPGRKCKKSGEHGADPEHIADAHSGPRYADPGTQDSQE